MSTHTETDRAVKWSFRMGDGRMPSSSSGRVAWDSNKAKVSQVARALGAEALIGLDEDGHVVTKTKITAQAGGDDHATG